MPFTIYEGGPTPDIPKRSPSPKKSKGSWLGRLIRWIFGAKTSNIAEKTQKVATSSLEPPQTKEYEEMTDRYNHNYNTVMEMNSETLPKYSVRERKLGENEEATSSEEQKEVIALVQQTMRQAKGKVFSATHGFGVVVSELAKADRLRLHVANNIPEANPPADVANPLSVLRPQSSSSMPKKLERKRTERRLERRKTVRQIMKRSLSQERLGAEESGVNVAHSVSVKDSKVRVAIAKSVNATDVGDKIFLIEHGKGPQNEDDDALQKKYERLGGVHELLASELDLMLGSAFRFPLATHVPSEGTTHHTFVQSKGSYRETVAKEGFDNVTKKMPTAPAQAAVFGWMTLGALDAHDENILIKEDGTPVPIDLGNILGPTPDSPEAILKGSYFDWPCLDQPLDPTLKKTIAEMDINQAIYDLHENLKMRNPKVFEDPTLEIMVLKELKHLGRRLEAVQMGVKAGLSQRQILALFMPTLSEEEIGDKTSFVALGPELQKKSPFVQAWREAEKPDGNFEQAIAKQIEAVKADPKTREPMPPHMKELLSNPRVSIYFGGEEPSK